MIIGRFRVQATPERAEEVAAAMAAVEGPSRELQGVVHFDCVRSLTDPTVFLAAEVFADRDAFDRQNAQPEVAALIAMLEAGASTGPYEWTTWEVEATA